MMNHDNSSIISANKIKNLLLNESIERTDVQFGGLNFKKPYFSIWTLDSSNILKIMNKLAAD